MEKEIKILDIDVALVESALIKLGATKVFDDIRVITYFKNNRDEKPPFLKLTKEGEKLKLSVQNDVTHEEVKLFVSRKEECVALLEQLGYMVISEAAARRVSYELGAADFDIDVFPGIPPFLEVDMGTTSDLKIEEVLTKLDLNANKSGQMSTPEIFNVYGKDYFELYKV
jgi:adenylate cyclase class 2